MSVVLFALLAVLVTVVTDLHDRTFPQQISAKAAATLDIGPSGLSDSQALRDLGAVSDELGLGLVKLAPDLAGDQSAQVFVMLGSRTRPPGDVRRFGSKPPAKVRGPQAIAHSYASGEYLVTGATSRLGEFRHWLRLHHIGSKWSDDTLGSTLLLVVRQGSFATSLLAAVALMVSLVLFWLSVKAKGRALRVLAGVPVWRIQIQDLTSFAAAVTLGAAACVAVSTAYTAAAHGAVFVPYFLMTSLTLDGVVVALTMTCALAMSVWSLPRPESLAAREPAVRSLRKVSVVLKAVAFTLVLFAVTPAVAALTDSREAAEQQARWTSLSDQVALNFPAAVGESDFQRTKADVAAVVLDAARDDQAALSYTWIDAVSGAPGLQAHQALSLVNPRWLELMTGGDARSHALYLPDEVPLSMNDVPGAVRDYLRPNLELWSREGLSGTAMLDKMSFFRHSKGRPLPVSLAGDGDLAFPDQAIVVVVPDLRIFNDSFLASLTSTRNLVLTGLGPTLSLVARHGLQGQVQVRYVAEEGLLRAQFTAFFAWLQAASFAALVVALVVSGLVGAFITAVLKARRDFPLRLAGERWWVIITGRIASEWGLGIILTVLVVLARGLQGAALVALVALTGLLISPVTHAVACRWTFSAVTLRRL